ALSRMSPIKKERRGSWYTGSLNIWLCLYSSRENTMTFLTSGTASKRRTTACPKVPVPPVIRIVLPCKCSVDMWSALYITNAFSSRFLELEVNKGICLKYAKKGYRESHRCVEKRARYER